MHTKRCFFIGHRETPDDVLAPLKNAVERHITEYGVTEFVVGHYGEFDRLAAEVVIAAKKTHPYISLLLLLPYHPSERPIDVPKGFDNTCYPVRMEKVPRNLAIVRANRYMVEDHIIAYAWHPASNARNLLDYAQRRAKKGLVVIQNLAEDKG